MFSPRGWWSGRPALGPLEVRVLEALWARGAAAAVRDIQAAFPQLAYTTLMTTLDRLHRKGLLTRTRAGRAFLYEPQLSREQFLGEVASDSLVSLLPQDGSSRPILSMFVEAVGRRDATVLDELETLVRAARRRQRRSEDA
jgi:predicted transcriptional regulator